MKKHRTLFKQLGLLCAALAVLIAVATVLVRRAYMNNLQPVSSQASSQIVNIPIGSSIREIAKLLKEKSIIRSSEAFEYYVKSKEAGELLLAGSYDLSPSQSVQEIVTILSEGKVASDLITLLPGQRLDQLRNTFIKSGFKADEVDAALSSANYINHPALVDKPVGATLEGYLYPESFHKTSNTKLQDIIRLSLDEMQKRLTPELRGAFTVQGLTTHQGVILASIIEKEVSKPDDKRQVAQVLLKRLRENIPLGADPTAPYGAVLAGQEPSLTYDSAYNTHTNRGLPPGPISNASESSLQAAAQPAAGDWLFFVSGDDGNTYFSRTQADHEALAEKHCKQLCGR